MKKTVLVVTPCYNAENFVKDCISSVSASITDDLFDVIHVLIDDSSTDSTLDVLKSHENKNTRVLSTGSNLGPGGTRNFGINSVESDYIFCLDADDVLFQTGLLSLFKLLEERDSPWGYGGFLASDANLSYMIGRDYWGGYQGNVSDYLFDMLTGRHFFQQNSMYTSELFKSVAGFTEEIEFGEDLDLCVKFLLSGVMPVYIPAPLYLHRFHDNNISKVGERYDPYKHKQDLMAEYARYKDQLNEIFSDFQRDTINQFYESSRATM